MTSRSFLEFLLDQGEIPADSLFDLIAARIRSQPFLIEVLVGQGILRPETAVRALCLQSRKGLDFKSACRELNAWTAEAESLQHAFEVDVPVLSLLSDSGLVHPTVLTRLLNEYKASGGDETPGLRILHTDDSRFVHRFIDECLSDTSHAIDHVFDGEEALARLTTDSSRYSVILLDWEMPKLDGPSTLVELRRRGIKTPVIMLTQRTNPEDIQKMLDAGASEYIMKPFTREILLEKIHRSIELAAEQAAKQAAEKEVRAS